MRKEHFIGFLFLRFFGILQTWMMFGLTKTGSGEPGSVGVEVHVFYSDWRVRAGPLRHTDAHQRILLLWSYYHLKHPQRGGKGEVKML